jgi:AGZA family xanthine/uracil permease-like MFS transporter
MGCSWNAALAAVVLSSIIFLLITISGLREAILNIIPIDLKLGIGAAIGFFLAFLGLKGAGIIVADPSTFVTLGAMTSAPALLALIGILITLIFYVQKVPGAVFFGLIITAILGLIFTVFGFGAGDPLMPSVPAEFISFSFDTSLVGGFISGFGELFTNIPNLIMILFSLVFVTFFDTTGTLLGIANQAGYIDEKGEIEGIEKAFLVDALSGVIGSICGTSTLTAYVESATGVGSGGRTGLAAIVTGILFLLSVFFAPTVLALFTSTVTAAALVMVGVLMIMQLKDVQWDSLVVAASVFMTIIMMVLTYSISLGIAWGFVTYTVATIATGKYKEISWGIWVLAIVFFLYLFFGL